MTIETQFDLDDRVYIIDLNLHGRVKSIWVVPRGIQYEIRYFDKAKPETIYFYEDELSEEKDVTKFGIDAR